MTSKFTEILDTANAPAYTHPHLNVSLEDILAEEGRKRSSSESSESLNSNSSAPRFGSKSPDFSSLSSPSPTKESIKRRFTLGRKRMSS